MYDINYISLRKVIFKNFIFKKIHNLPMWFKTIWHSKVKMKRKKIVMRHKQVIDRYVRFKEENIKDIKLHFMVKKQTI